MAGVHRDRASLAAYMRAWSPGRIAELRAEAFRTLGEECVGCGLSDKRLLVFDHIAGDGNTELWPCGSRGGTLTKLYSVRRNPERYRILCHNCNWLAYHHGILGEPPQKSLQTTAVTTARSMQTTLFAEVR